MKKNRMQTYAILIGRELIKVRGIVNANGWLEWVQCGDSTSHGISKPGGFTLWKDRATLLKAAE